MFNSMITKSAIAALMTVTGVLSYSLPLKSQPKATSTPTFTCTNETDPPTIWITTDADAEPDPIFSWYPQYLLPSDTPSALCQQVAEKLQNQYTRSTPVFLAYQEVNAHSNEWQVDVCLVTQSGNTCRADDSELLFSLVGGVFRDPVQCMMTRKDPNALKAENRCPPRARDPVLSVPGGRYKPQWWLF